MLFVVVVIYNLRCKLSLTSYLSLRELSGGFLRQLEICVLCVDMLVHRVVGYPLDIHMLGSLYFLYILKKTILSAPATLVQYILCQTK